jgi:hypothetical protein
MNRSTTVAVVAAAMALTTAACSNQRQAPYDRCLDSRDPSMCHAVVNAGGDADDFIQYGMQGYMLGMMNGQQYVYHDDHYRGPSHYYPQNVRETRVIIDRRPATVNTYRQQQFALEKAKAAGTVKPYVPGSYTVKAPATTTLNPARTSQAVPPKATATTSSVKSPVYSYKPAQAPTTTYKAPTTSYSAPAKSYSAPTPSYSAPKSYSAPSYSAPARSYSAPTVSYSSSSKK